VAVPLITLNRRTSRLWWIRPRNTAGIEKELARK
jgi:hypothetical protein